MKRIAILTSSRADYGIYLPLIKELKINSFFELTIVVFGTHLSPFHGYTIDQIINDGFEVKYKIETILASDTPNAISTAMAVTSLKFAEFWNLHQNDFDLVFCLGDRYEMFAAVSAGIPYGIKFAHLHGGEKTLGAVDNIFRHSITLASKYHFVSCETHAKRVAELIEDYNNIYNVGSLSLDNLSNISLLTKEEFLTQFQIDLNIPTILVTVHPETVEPDKNETNIEELSKALLEINKYQVLITLPNADTFGSVIRHRLLKLQSESFNRIICVENLGTKGYFSAMHHCSFLLGNTSSGIIEAASFEKWVINLGNRQQGRMQSNNILNAPFNKEIILNQINQIEIEAKFIGNNIYYRGNVARKVCSILEKLS